MTTKDSKTVNKAALACTADAESDAIGACARLECLAALMQNSTDGIFEFETEHFIALGDMIQTEARRAKDAYYVAHALAVRGKEAND